MNRRASATTKAENGDGVSRWPEKKGRIQALRLPQRPKMGFALARGGEKGQDQLGIGYHKS